MDTADLLRDLLDLTPKLLRALAGDVTRSVQRSVASLIWPLALLLAAPFALLAMLGLWALNDVVGPRRLQAWTASTSSPPSAAASRPCCTYAEVPLP